MPPHRARSRAPLLLLFAAVLFPGAPVDARPWPTPSQSNGPTEVHALLGDFFGEWRSEFYEPEKIPEQYRSGFFLRIQGQFGGDAVRIESGQQRDSRVAMIGLAVWDPGDEQVVLVEYNQDGGLYFRGHYEQGDAPGVRRVYEVSFPDGSTSRFREVWRWNDAERTSFDWITEEWPDGEYRPRGLVVKLKRNNAGSN